MGRMEIGGGTRVKGVVTAELISCERVEVSVKGMVRRTEGPYEDGQWESRRLGESGELSHERDELGMTCEGGVRVSRGSKKCTVSRAP